MHDRPELLKFQSQIELNFLLHPIADESIHDVSKM